MDRPAGFTLLEVIVTIALIGIAAAIAAIALGQWLPGYRLKGAAGDLFNNLHHTHSQAITENRPWAILFNASAPQGYVVVSSGPDNTLGTADDIETRSTSLATYGSSVAFGYQAGVEIVDGATAVTDAVDFAGDQAVFNPNGTSTGGYVYLTGNADRTYAVGTFASGVVRMKRWNGSSWQ